MPAAEQTWRDTKALHKIFGVTSFLMLVATIWMFVADHNREWKPVQRTNDRIDVKMNSWRELQYTTEDATKERNELQANYDGKRRQPIPAALMTEFESQMAKTEATKNISFEPIRKLADAFQANPEDTSTRDKLIGRMSDIVRKARLAEDNLLSARKFKSADRDAAVATEGLMVRDNRPLKELEAQQGEIGKLTSDLDALTRQYQVAKDDRNKLDRIVKEITKEEDIAKEALVKSEADLKQLGEAKDQRTSTYINWVGWLPLPGKRFLELPILDAFNSPRKIDNLWSTGNDINYNFSKVRRFDRCTTCHQAMQKTVPGSAIVPAYEGETLLDFQVAIAKPEGEAAAAAAPAGEAKKKTPPTPIRADSETVQKQLELELGLRIADEGLVNRNDATVQFIRPESPGAAARAILNWETTQLTGEALRKAVLMSAAHLQLGQPHPGILVGDVIVAVNGDPVTEPRKVATRLLDAVHDGKDFSVTVRRGLPNPYQSHPRLDLFVGSLSPHKMSEFACTICHEGQGSATAFKYASHTPNTEQQRKDWAFDHGWFDNTHWIFPMYPERFAESACLKCHHTVTELEPSPQFPDAPAPTVVHGFHLIRKYACYGCHEINGFDGKKRIGPDLRLEPNFFAAALQLRADPGFANLTPEEKDWIDQLVDHPDRDQVRYRVLEMLDAEAKAEQPRLGRWSLDKLTPLLRDIESPGALRKAGPSLRFAASKLDPAFMYDWIHEPKHFRPTTRMPQFFGLTKHLEGSPGIEESKKLEPIEILGLATFLQARSQKFDYLEPPAGITEAADVARGKVQFQTRGCLACHNHKAFNDAVPYRNPDEIVQGPDLSGVGDKFPGENQQKWLYSWIRQPSRYHARTVMPDLFLEPIHTKNPDNNQETVTDPAADIVAFLVAESKTGWQPANGTMTKPTDADREQLDRFVKLNLADTFAQHQIEGYAKTGIPEALRSELKGAEVELVVPANSQTELSAEQKLMYIGSKTISKFGCYGCHDIAGFEDAKPIGTVLADWGKKEPARLAFEHITHYIDHQHSSHPETGKPETGKPETGKPENAAATDGAGHTEAAHADESLEDREYFIAQLKAGNRIGFLYQKLREPRSYDFHKTENKKYSERLRMPHFPFDGHDREAVMSFVLGLIGEPPNDKYIYKPSERTKALLAGREVLEKFNCGGCHILSPEKWDVIFEREKFGEQSPVKIYPFLRSHFTPQALAESAKVDRAGLGRAALRGMPAIDDLGMPIAYDETGEPLEAEAPYDVGKVELPLELWKETAIGGKPFEVGVLPVNVPTALVERRYGSDGGFLTKYLLPHVVALEKQVNPAAKGTEAWGWLPPPLIGEGHKVQTDWLHSFLLNPFPIRPATFLRMPRFNMTPAEATQLVNYFAAVDNAEYPYAFSSRRQPDHLQQADSAYAQTLNGAEFDGKPRTRLDDAMRIVVNNNYCVKCHRVGDFEPTGADRAKAPNLSQVYRRLRPEYARNWIANPKSYLPYTSMPVNVPYDPDAPNLGGVAQDLYHGTSIDQVDALVDLLMNFDEYAKQRSSIATLVEKYGGVVTPGAPGAPATPAPATPARPAASGDGGQ